jgi:SHOCT-like domain
MGVDPLDEVLRLVSEGRLTAEEAAPILAALDDRAGFAPEGAPDATPPPSAGPGSEPPGGFGSNPPPSFAPGDASRAERGGGPSILRIEVTDAGRQVVNLRLPIAVGKFALDRIPGLPAEQVSRVREALRSGYRGSVLEVDDDGDGVRIVLE